MHRANDEPGLLGPLGPVIQIPVGNGMSAVSLWSPVTTNSPR